MPLRHRNLMKDLDEERQKSFESRTMSHLRHDKKVAAQKSPDLLPFAVHWDTISDVDIQEFRDTLESATDESPLQAMFERKPTLLIQPMFGGHGRWVVPQKRLGAELVPDFLCAQASSLGLQWLAVELESPTKPLYNKNGDPSRYLNHAIRQIQDWRTWLTKNIDYANRSKQSSGLGLIDIDGNIPGLILIGRRNNLSDESSLLRRQMINDLRIAIHTYDWLLENCESRHLAINQRANGKWPHHERSIEVEKRE